MNKPKIKKLALNMLIVMLIGSIYLNFKLYYSAKISSKIKEIHIEEKIFNLIEQHSKEKQEIKETLKMKGKIDE